MHPTIQMTVDREFLRVCPPQMAYDWLARQPREGRTRRPGGASEPSPDVERVLLQREDPFIDHALARFGANHTIAWELYDRLSSDGRKVMRACHRSGGGPRDAFSGLDPNQTETFDEITCWVTNPDLGDDLLTEAITRSGPFADLDDDHYRLLLRWLGRNPRLAEPYVETFIDGYDEYSWHRPLKAAWDLAVTVPTTMEWASSLSDLYETMSPYGQIDPSTVDRWRIDVEPEKPDQWFGRSVSFYLRASLAKSLPSNYDKFGDQDLAVRCAGYQTFSPHVVRAWPEAAKRDGTFFFEYALRNKAIWQDSAARNTLARIAWALPDPRSDMDEINTFRAVERRMRESHPSWFVDEEIETSSPPRSEAGLEGQSSVTTDRSRRFFSFGKS